jgi:hypothetical protein
MTDNRAEYRRAKAEALAILGRSAADDFYRDHRGGKGAVIMVMATSPGQRDRIAVFGSLEKADAWRLSLGDDYTCVFDPLMVDDPDW